MKRILITGKSSYIGKSFFKWLESYPKEFEIETISVRDELWKNVDFARYDVIYHVAGIAHIKETKENSDLYYKVNRDLAYDLAKKAKNDGVKYFIFLSSMSVYGIDKGIITKHTPTLPKTNYGISKLEAEKLIVGLESEKFKVAVIRPPMIYGKDSKGNFPRLVSLILRSPIFPDIENQRSMLHIDNLCEFIRLLIKNEESGIFYPQNKEYVKTSEIAKNIAELKRKRIKLTRIFNGVIRILGIKIGLINKVFGTLVYEKEMSIYSDDYQIRNFRESLELSLGSVINNE